MLYHLGAALYAALAREPGALPDWGHYLLLFSRLLMYLSTRTIAAMLTSFLVTMLVGRPLIRWLHRRRMRDRVKDFGTISVTDKRGTPTMGGLLIITVVLGIFLLLRGVPQGGIIAPLLTLFLVGLLGAVDDYLNARTGEGISARQKMLWLVVVGVVTAFQIQNTYAITTLFVPFVGDIPIAPWVYTAFAAFAIIAAANGVNLTDGLDGLAAGTLVFAFVAYLLIALLNEPVQPNLAFLCALIIGALLGFLWFNVHPAQVFMGDSGSLALGAALAVTALITSQILLLPLIGLVFVIETGSVVVQRAYFRVTHGKRLFRFTPLHHHFELLGWDEEKITLRFWIFGIIVGLIGVTLFLATINKLT